MLTAQNWLDLQRRTRAIEFRSAPSAHGRRSCTPPGMGMSGGALATGRIAKYLREWTLGSQFNLGTGLPLTPIYPGAVRGTGVTGPLRPDYTGADVYARACRFVPQPAAYAAPAAGKWGNAGRNSITGPKQFTMSASTRAAPSGPRNA